jgi:hypothetical protein
VSGRKRRIFSNRVQNLQSASIYVWQLFQKIPHHFMVLTTFNKNTTKTSDFFSNRAQYTLSLPSKILIWQPCQAAFP